MDQQVNWKQCHECVREILLTTHPNIDLQSLDGEHLLHLAIKDNQPGVVGLLIQRGVDLNIKDGSGKTPLMAAMTYQHPEIINMLRNAGAQKEVPQAELNIRGTVKL